MFFNNCIKKNQSQTHFEEGTSESLYYLALIPPCINATISIIKKLQYNFPKMRGGSKAVWNFSEKSSHLAHPSFPKDACRKPKKNKSTTRQNIARLMHRKFVITTRKEYTFCNTEGTSSGQSTFGEFYIVSKGLTNHYGKKCLSSPSIVKCGK